MPIAQISTEPIAPLTLVDRVHQRIWDWIQADRLKPGDWLRIQDLARTLEVSDTPVREALIRLQQNGLVDTIPHVGTRVRRFTRQDIEELFDLREALECYALQRGTANLSQEPLRGLKRQLEQAGTELDGGDVGPAVIADVALHTELIRAAGNSRILSLFENLRDQFKMFAGFGNRTADGPRRFLTIHLRLVGLLLKGEIENATVLMREHMRLAKAQSLRGYFGPAGAGTETNTPDRRHGGTGKTRRGRTVGVESRPAPGGEGGRGANGGGRRQLTTSRSQALRRGRS
jgi:DNA-binding GntR family transcriptional regulator